MMQGPLRPVVMTWLEGRARGSVEDNRVEKTWGRVSEMKGPVELAEELGEGSLEWSDLMPIESVHQRVADWQRDVDVVPGLPQAEIDSDSSGGLF